MKELILIYELDQVDACLERYQRSPSTARIVALNFWVERELAARGVPFDSFAQFKLSDIEAAQWLKRARTIAREWYRLPELEFLQYKRIRLAESIEPALDSCLQIIFYYLAPLDKLFAKYQGIERVIVLNKSGVVAPTAGLFSLFEVNAVVDVAKFLTARYRFVVEELGPRPAGSPKPFPRQPLSNKLISVWNMLARVAARKQHRIFVSDTWAHIAPFVGTMDDTELVLMDRSEVRNIPKRQLWAHRMRFIHLLTWQNPRRIRRARRLQQEFAAQWREVRHEVEAMPALVHDGATLWPLVSPALNWFVEGYVARPIYEAMSFERMFIKERINKVLLRVSVSMHQSHFFIAAKVAHELGIPSIELQHAGAVLDPESPHARLEADYLATYGSLTADIHIKNHGLERARLRPVGSPRFDRYLHKSVLGEAERAKALVELGLDPKRPVALVATPADNVVLIPHEFDSYEVARLFESVRDIQQALPDIQLLFKFRSHCPPSHRAYLQELFGGQGFVIATDDLYYRIQMSDVVLSNNSTAMYETMMAHKPLVLYPWKETDVAPLVVYTQASPAPVGHQVLVDELSRVCVDAEYRSERVKRQDEFLQHNYSFDGQASTRIKSLLRENLSIPQQLP